MFFLIISCFVKSFKLKMSVSLLLNFSQFLETEGKHYSAENIDNFRKVQNRIIAKVAYVSLITLK